MTHDKKLTCIAHDHRFAKKESMRAYCFDERPIPHPKTMPGPCSDLGGYVSGEVIVVDGCQIM